MGNEELLPWLDLETFGLERNSPILEVGIIITDLNLNEIGAFNALCWEDGYEEQWAQADNFVRNMHGGEGGLVERARAYGRSRYQVESEAAAFLNSQDAIDLPLCGNSVGTDKDWLSEQMPNLLSAFHYRVIDVSTLKELCRRYNRPLFESSPEKKLAHTAIDDLHESIEEFRFYKENFLEIDRW